VAVAAGPSWFWVYRLGLNFRFGFVFVFVFFGGVEGGVVVGWRNVVDGMGGWMDGWL
jgi:hypothetical protein